jgi:hypothetical protein
MALPIEANIGEGRGIAMTIVNFRSKFIALGEAAWS